MCRIYGKYNPKQRVRRKKRKLNRKYKTFMSGRIKAKF